MLSCLVPVLFTFYIQGVLKLKKNNSGAKVLRELSFAQIFSSDRLIWTASQKFIYHVSVKDPPYNVRKWDVLLK
jgi:hypothetical protein